MINVIFDVDGTLVDSYALDTTLFCQAVDEILGQTRFREDWAEYTHVTDAGILAEVFQDNAISPDGRMENAVRERFGQLVTTALSDQPCAAVQGAEAAINGLHQRPNVAVGVATGGWSHTARAKLGAAGFDPSSWILASSDDHAERTVIMRTCLERLPDPGAPTVYIGDGEWDQIACKALDWAFVGVGARLKGKTPVWIEHYASCDLGQVLQAALAN
ncbi:MAG: HAD family hydrolase [Alphaproteobacteria bacterium]|nr:HAD family hydrolase [Alphaproteobacteria bacterium]